MSRSDAGQRRDDYDYDLPPERIAQQPVEPRDAAKLLVLDRSERRITDHQVRDLPDLLSPGDLIVVNDTRVVPAALVGRRDATGGRWTGLFLAADEQGHWLVLASTRGKPSPGEQIVLVDRHGQDAARIELVAKVGKEWLVRPLTQLGLSVHDSSTRPTSVRSGEPTAEALRLLEQVGRTPLPGYIRGGAASESDQARYQTVFAERPGAVAAPTAGLHLTTDLLARLDARGVERQTVTLHVGMGTFRPIEVENLADHTMHKEWGSLPWSTAEAIRACRARGGRVIAIGTTTVRVLESAAAAGVALSAVSGHAGVADGTSGPTNGGHDPSGPATDRFLDPNAHESDSLEAWSGWTDLFIRPGHVFCGLDCLMTNFHVPKSTLLVLVSALAGRELIGAAYDHALTHDYRFFSYGDAMLIR